MHFRTHHYRDSRDGDALIVRVDWECGVCHEDNDTDDRFCWQCSSERGDWLCGCGHKNPKRERECEECGRPKEQR